LADREIGLRKDDYLYRRFTGTDGYVRICAEPGMDRNTIIGKALEAAQRSDAALAELVAARIMPRHITRYRERSGELYEAFQTPEAPEIIGVKRA
jgi:hypothetical protein